MILLQSIIDNISSFDVLIYLIVLAVIIAVYYFLSRWVFEIDKLVKLQEEQNELLKQVIEKLNK